MTGPRGKEDLEAVKIRSTSGASRAYRVSSFAGIATRVPARERLSSVRGSASAAFGSCTGGSQAPVADHATAKLLPELAA